jgi:endonuclease/exonuclease/phosphatase family metal-dependent hydrolase
VNWNVRTVDWVAGAAMLVVLSVGALFALGAWAAIPGLTPVDAPPTKVVEPPDAAVSADDEPEERRDEPAEELAERAQQDDREPVRKVKRLRPTEEDRARVEVETVPESGSAMQVVLPGSEKALTTGVTSVDFVVSSFNVLGSSHTRGKGARRGFAPGATRAGYAAGLIAAHDVDIVGLQELQSDQMRTLTSRLPGYGIFPGPSMSWREAENSIMWRSDKWYPVQSSTIAIPYFRGSVRQMPYIRLRNAETGTDIWVANFHNPANTPRWGNNARWRAEATRRQIALANELQSRTKLPVVFTGDFNDRAEYFCPLVAQTALESPNGGSSQNGFCSPPPAPQIDWIFATPEIKWTSYSVDRGPLVGRTSDHPMILATGRLSMVDQAIVDEASETLERLEDSGGDSATGR